MYKHFNKNINGLLIFTYLGGTGRINSKQGTIPKNLMTVASRPLEKYCLKKKKHPILFLYFQKQCLHLGAIFLTSFMILTVSEGKKTLDTRE